MFTSYCLLLGVKYLCLSDSVDLKTNSVVQVQIENEDMNNISDTQVRVSSASGGRTQVPGLLAGTDPSFISHYQSTILAILFHNTVNSLKTYITTDFI